MTCKVTWTYFLIVRFLFQPVVVTLIVIAVLVLVLDRLGLGPGLKTLVVLVLGNMVLISSLGVTYFFISDIRALCRSGLSDTVPECQKLKTQA